MYMLYTRAPAYLPLTAPGLRNLRTVRALQTTCWNKNTNVGIRTSASTLQTALSNSVASCCIPSAAVNVPTTSTNADNSYRRQAIHACGRPLSVYEVEFCKRYCIMQLKSTHSLCHARSPKHIFQAHTLCNSVSISHGLRNKFVA